MSLAVAVPCGTLAAVAYGVSTAVQHSVVHRDSGRADARSLVRLLVNPRWLMSVGGDAIGLVLQVVALATGPVVLIQPLLVLAVPVSLPVGWALGGPKPRRRDFLACVAIIAGLGTFFLVLGNPGTAQPMTARSAEIAIAVALVVGVVACGSVRTRSAVLRAGTYGATAGAWFGLVGVLLNATSRAWQDHGTRGLTMPEGWVPLAGVILLGAAAVTLTQISFQVGPLAASFPANEACAPVVAVVLGAVMLNEHVPISYLAMAAYIGCLICIIAGLVQLASALPATK